MGSVLLAGMEASGKTTIIYGLMRVLSGLGYESSYFKPVSRGVQKVGPDEWADNDVLAMKDGFDMKEDISVISPLVIGESFLELSSEQPDLLGRIQSSYEKLSRDRDVTFIESLRAPHYLSSIGLSAIDVAERLRCEVIQIAGGGYDEMVDEAIYYRDRFAERGIDTMGVIFNMVPMHLMERVKKFHTDFLRDKGIDVLGVIPDRHELISTTILDISTVLNAEVLEGHDHLNNLVQDVLIGAMGVEAAVKWLRRSKRPVIITGGDRTELLLTSLELKPSGIILTGNLYPAMKVLTKAKEKGVPILLVPADTFSTAEKLWKLHGRVTPHSLRIKEKIIIETVRKNVEVNTLIERAIER